MDPAYFEMSRTDDFLDLEKLQFLSIQGPDKQGRRIVQIVGKYFSGRFIDKKRLLEYILFKIRHQLLDMKFIVVYFHTSVKTEDNNPGMLVLRWIYARLPKDLKQKLERVYFVHPGLQSRLFLATFGRFFLGQGLYWKIEYVSRVGFLWDYMKKDRIQVPEFVYKHDMELERRPLMDYGLDADPFVAVEMDPALYVKNRYRLEGMHAASYCQVY